MMKIILISGVDIILGSVFVLFSFQYIPDRIEPIDGLCEILDTLEVKSEFISENNSYILSVLQARESDANNGLLGRRSEISQARTIYFGILTILISLLLSRKKKKDTKIEVYLYLILLFVILAMFFLDIHLQDLMDRSISGKDMTATAIHTLLKDNNMNTIYYELDYKEWWDRLSVASSTPDRYYRKVVNAFHPYLIQVVYYYIPFFLIYILLEITINPTVTRRQFIF